MGKRLVGDIKDVIALDGKALRATKNTIDKIGPLYLVNAWCSANQLVLGQVEIDSKSNEIKLDFIPRLNIIKSHS